MMYKKICLPIIALIFLFSCEPELKDFKPGSGDADFSVFIAVGCAQTAGYANNELYKSGQIVSFPNIISRQLLHVGGGEFKQPLMLDEMGFGKKLRLGFIEDCSGDSILSPVLAGGMADEGNLTNIFTTDGPFHNLGVPGAKIRFLTTQVSSTQNPYAQYFSRFSSLPGAVLLNDALNLNASFFSLWIGTADILDYAIGGGTGDSIIDAAQFDQHFSHLIQQLAQGNTKGIVANIPDILQYPYFSHIDAAGLWAYDEGTAEGKRLLQQGELVLLSANERVRCEGWGNKNLPIPENRYLSIDQIQYIRERTATFNSLIRERANDHNLAFVDMHFLMQNISNGLIFDGITFTNTFITGGLFSMDGINYTRRGNAITANAFIEAINTKYKATIPLVSVSQFQGIEFP